MSDKPSLQRIDDLAYRAAVDLAASSPRADYTPAQLPSLTPPIVSTDIIMVYRNGQLYQTSGTNTVPVVVPASVNAITPTGGTLAITGNETVSGGLSMGYSFLRNPLLNGAMMIDQRNNGASGTAVNVYTVDQWQYVATQAAKGTWSQAAVSSGLGPTSGYALTYVSSSAYAVSASDTFTFQQPIMANDIASWQFGTATAKPLSLSFWVYSSLVGTFGGALQNYAQSRSYPFTYTTSTASSWTYVSLTIPGDTGGTWVLAGTGGGARLSFGMGVGSTYSGAAGTWASSNYVSATGAVSVVGTNGATFYITQVQLETGPLATPFEQRLYGQELTLCQRYCYALNTNLTVYADFGIGYVNSSTAAYFTIPFPVPMRATPSLTVVGAAANFSVVSGGSTVTACSALPTLGGNASQFAGMVLTTVASGLTTGQAVMLAANAASAALQFSAVL